MHISAIDITKLYDGFIVFVTNYEIDSDTFLECCIPRIVCSSEQKLVTEDTIHIK